MSERIIKALLKLFAVFARQDSDSKNRNEVIELFLAAQLNKELARTYLPTFAEEYQEVVADINRITEKAGEKGGDVLKFKIEAKLAARIHRICNNINQELTQKQKLFVVISLLEFISSNTESEITQTEKEFLDIVVDDLNIEQKEYEELRDFILNSFEEIPPSSNLLIINNDEDFSDTQVKHILSKHLSGIIKVFYLSSSNLLIFRSQGVGEITLNSQPVLENKINFINIGSAIRSHHIKPIYYSQILNVFNVDNSEEGVVFKAEGIRYVFKGGNIGLEKVYLEEESGSLVGIMGASGAGKSTLLNVLNGTYAPTHGKVTINGVDLHNDKDGELEGLIGFVPQDDLLIKELTVYDNLYYNAKLCFDNLTEEEIVEKVERVLQSLGLFERKHNIVGDELKKEISGGQRKRLNIALELIREPAILFLDEPTSGLSSKDSENIMDLLKELALKGKLVFVVIHQPSSDIFKTFDRLLLLDTGGYQIYYGPPVDSIMYFKEQIHQADWYISECPTCGNVNPEQIFNITEAKILNEDGTPLLNEKKQEIRKLAPTDWYDIYNKNNPHKEDSTKKQPKGLPEITFKIPNWIRQLKVFIVRDVLSKLSNKQYMLINSLESPIIAIFLAFIIKYWDVDESTTIGYTLMNNENLPVYIFMLVICAFFIGLTVSAEEIFRDQKIRKRESFLNLSWSSYLVSKIIILLCISAIQSFVFVLIGNAILEIPGMLLEYWFIAFSVWSFANMLGLIISDSFNDVKTIYILIPFMVIPQIILSGIIVNFDKLNPRISNPQDIPFYGEIITSRWAYEALATYQFSNNAYEKPFFRLNQTISNCSYKRGEWSNQLTNKVNAIERNLRREGLEKEIEQDLTVLYNELYKEQFEQHKTRFQYLDYLTIDKITTEILTETRNFIQSVRQFYVDKNNHYRAEKDALTYALIEQAGLRALNRLGIPEEQRTPRLIDSVGNAAFLQIKKRHYNETLEDFCTNKNDFTVLIEYKGHFVQKMDPIYQIPEGNFIRAHFYAPVKPFFGRYIKTYWANAIVIWFMSILMYVVLYFRLFRTLIDYLGNIKLRRK